MRVTQRLLLHLAGGTATERKKDGGTLRSVTYGSYDSRNFP
jgi:hypothetical protein